MSKKWNAQIGIYQTFKCTELEITKKGIKKSSNSDKILVNSRSPNFLKNIK